MRTETAQQQPKPTDMTVNERRTYSGYGANGMGGVLVWDQRVGSSNLSTPTILRTDTRTTTPENMDLRGAFTAPAPV